METSNTQVATQQNEMLSYNLHQAGSMMQLATMLSDFVKEKNLCQNIKGRQYVNVEGWQFCGGMLGILPVVRSTKNISTASEVKYEADVELLNIHSGSVCGSGNAVCSNKESGKKQFEEYAINSMAQTRAIGKAYRNMIGWLMKAAGYETTPLEEMDQVVQAENEVREAVFEYLKSENRDEATAVWNKYKQHRNNFYFQKAAKAMGALFPKEQEKPASPKQIDLIVNLVNSHHIEDDYKDFVVSNLEEPESLTSEEAGEMIEKLQAMIDAGMKYESSTPATIEQQEKILDLLDNPLFSSEERESGKIKLKKGYSIAQANKAIAKLESLTEERSKEEIPHG